MIVHSDGGNSSIEDLFVSSLEIDVTNCQHLKDITASASFLYIVGLFWKSSFQKGAAEEIQCSFQNVVKSYMDIYMHLFMFTI